MDQQPAHHPRSNRHQGSAHPRASRRALGGVRGGQTDAAWPSACDLSNSVVIGGKPADNWPAYPEGVMSLARTHACVLCLAVLVSLTAAWSQPVLQGASTSASLDDLARQSLATIDG